MDHPAEIRIVAAHAGPLVLVPVLPAMYGGSVPGIRRFEAHGPYGHVTLQEMPGQGMTIWYNNYVFHNDDTLRIAWDIPVLRLWFSLRNSFYYAMEGETENVLHERGFNIEYAPLLRQTLRLRAGQTYTCVEFHLSSNAFVDWMSFFRGVEEFLHRVKMQQPSRLGRKNGIAGAELLMLVDDLLYCTYTAAIRRKYLTYKLMELLFLSLDQLTGSSFSQSPFLSETSVARIYEARDILIGNLARRYTLKELGIMVGLSPWQLKSGFKAIFSLSIADYLQETRMRKARLLLEETDLPIARIGDIVGYTHPFAFSSAFRKYYGYAPSLVRKGRRTRKD